MQSNYSQYRLSQRDLITLATGTGGALQSESKNKSTRAGAGCAPALILRRSDCRPGAWPGASQGGMITAGAIEGKKSMSEERVWPLLWRFAFYIPSTAKAIFARMYDPTMDPRNVHL